MAAVVKVYNQFKGLQTDHAAVEAHLEKLEKVLDIYEVHLAKSQYLAGDFFSLADLSHIPLTHAFLTLAKKGEHITKRPAVKAWYEDISARPSWKKVQELIAASSPQAK
ncbi:unnamed protein product [Calypogeia fissa]